MRIAVCDDDEIMLCMLKETLLQCLSDEHIESEVDDYSEGMELLKNIQKYDAIFLDIEMPAKDGIEVGRDISDKNPGCMIIMVTGREERYRDAFHIHASDFITKPFTVSQIKEALDIVLAAKEGARTLEMYNSRILYNIPERDIKYIEVYNGALVCHAYGNEYRIEESLTELMNRIDSRIFYRIRREMAVNLMWVEKYEKNSVCVDGRCFEVSRANRKDFEKNYNEYVYNHSKTS